MDSTKSRKAQARRRKKKKRRAKAKAKAKAATDSREPPPAAAGAAAAAADVNVERKKITSATVSPVAFLSESKAKGRHMLASSAIPRAAMVFTEEPFAFVVRSAHTSSVCAACFTPTATHCCEQCRSIFYCSQACRQAFHKLHKSECKLQDRVASIADAHDVDCDLLRLTLRSICRRAAFCSNEFEQQVAVLLHMSDRFSSQWRGVVKAACAELFDELPARLKVGGLTSRALFEVCCRINVNAHGMASDSNNTDSAFGLFRNVALMNHSCAPNCVCVNDGVTMCVRATRAISSGEELTYCYIDAYQTRQQRQADLKASKFFACKCTRCRKDMRKSIDRFMDGVLCERGDCGVYISGGDGKSGDSVVCDSCGLETEQSGGIDAIRDSARKALGEAMVHYEAKRARKGRDAFLGFLERFGGQLHELNVLVLNARVKLVMCLFSLDENEVAAGHCMQIVECMLRVIGDCRETANYAKLALRLATESNRLDLAEKAQRYLDAAMEVVSPLRQSKEEEEEEDEE